MGLRRRRSAATRVRLGFEGQGLVTASLGGCSSSVPYRRTRGGKAEDGRWPTEPSSHGDAGPIKCNAAGFVRRCPGRVVLGLGFDEHRKAQMSVFSTGSRVCETRAQFKRVHLKDQIAPQQS